MVSSLTKEFHASKKHAGIAARTNALKIKLRVAKCLFISFSAGDKVTIIFTTHYISFVPVIHGRIRFSDRRSATTH